jgi:membrane-associated protease RseP (regulator of RpoE activity)
MGEVRLLTLLRASVAIVSFAAALGAVATGQLALVFAVLLGGELLQAVLYELARRRAVARRRSVVG